MSDPDIQRLRTEIAQLDQAITNLDGMPDAQAPLHTARAAKARELARLDGRTPADGTSINQSGQSGGVSFGAGNSFGAVTIGDVVNGPIIRGSIYSGRDTPIAGRDQTIIHPTGTAAAPTSATAPTSPAAPDPVDLELSVTRAEEGYRAEARFTRPDSHAEVSIPPAPLRIAYPELLVNWLDPAAYGARLSADLFAAPDLRDLIIQALAVAQALRAPLRLRLRLDPADGPLNALRWETLRHPVTGDPLLTNSQVWLTRSLGSADWSPVDLAQRGQLRALALISAPTDLARYRLSPLDATAEVNLARTAFGPGDTTILGPGSATLTQLAAALRTGCDLLSLTAHGAMIAGQPRLWLEREDGTADVVDGGDLALRVRELGRKPLLAVLISCQSAGQGAEEVAAALGPQLVAAGIPAVVAMQGQITMQTVAIFTPALFAALRTDGRIDRAISEARAAVRDRPDGWMPVLFTRLRDGRIWQ